jgi:hypothetical protein
MFMSVVWGEAGIVDVSSAAVVLDVGAQFNPRWAVYAPFAAGVPVESTLASSSVLVDYAFHFANGALSAGFGLGWTATERFCLARSCGDRPWSGITFPVFVAINFGLHAEETTQR